MEGAAPQTDLLPRVALGHRPCTSHDGVKTREMGCSIFAKWFADIFSTRIENLIIRMDLHAHTHSPRKTRNTYTLRRSLACNCERTWRTANVPCVNPEAGGPALFSVSENLCSLFRAPVKHGAPCDAPLPPQPRLWAPRASPSHLHCHVLSPGGPHLFFCPRCRCSLRHREGSAGVNIRILFFLVILSILKYGELSHKRRWDR